MKHEAQTCEGSKSFNCSYEAHSGWISIPNGGRTNLLQPLLAKQHRKANQDQLISFYVSLPVGGKHQSHPLHLLSLRLLIHQTSDHQREAEVFLSLPWNRFFLCPFFALTNEGDPWTQRLEFDEATSSKQSLLSPQRHKPMGSREGIREPSNRFKYEPLREGGPTIDPIRSQKSSVKALLRRSPFPGLRSC